MCIIHAYWWEGVHGVVLTILWLGLSNHSPDDAVKEHRLSQFCHFVCHLMSVENKEHNSFENYDPPIFLYPLIESENIFHLECEDVTAIQGFDCGRVGAREFNLMSVHPNFVRFFAYEIMSGPIS